MTKQTQDIRINDMQELICPEALEVKHPLTDAARKTVLEARARIQDILHGRDDRLVVVVGPCSVHDPEAAMDYARRLAPLRAELGDRLEIVMRVYFEKPRTIAGWKGLINDPDLDGSFRINKGLSKARQLCLQVNEMGLPVGTEFLDTAVPQYLDDLVSWAAIGARTTESQIHREMASGLSCPVGFKNGTRGNVQIAIDAVRSAATPHHFMAMAKSGLAAIAHTSGNPDCHIILRGGGGTNFDADSVDKACRTAEKDGIRGQVMIDASHANSGKDPEKQPEVLADVAGQIAVGDGRITGIMIESHIVAGRQDLPKDGDLSKLTYGQSVTDGCIGWDDTVVQLRKLAEAVETRRTASARLAG
ncbi:Phospho-2-dehydro-3-deoxyheptonate aldolase, Phe-sensitive [Tritonibacter multivorans]|uniref:Phospho-2-dehydro-3-deoxyheptonate aldolase n=1 Tax=Tritonibacter multivorans TaxID=928856 RepID=A0A0P1G6Y2_9RHOB|nr:3-deoxy-7-phosphoheptulonate synthase [Tritonibacter multivorans]MDA7421219.1 3-deoxy-7-phosphoheptulonate synthase [Tritonibacter multivorans]CUH77483.1 Phospho-2-dehydro-3-deoxyheptonate aldolase, Phe-sensitive [Tritonibacter multivorans]SFD32798.1 3-deoxy-D-arabinoheptulosonate-7-phosphate synthase [Tritonibacter multivorans]